MNPCKHLWSTCYTRSSQISVLQRPGFLVFSRENKAFGRGLGIFQKGADRLFHYFRKRTSPAPLHRDLVSRDLFDERSRA